MSKEYEDKIYQMCKEAQELDFLEIIDSLCDRITWQIDEDGDTTLDDIGYFLYECYIIMEAINPRMTPEVNFLSALIMVLEQWEEDHEFVNKALGLPPES